MRRTFAFLRAIILIALPFALVLFANAQAAPERVEQISLSQYRQELARIDERLHTLPERPDDAASLRSSIPDEWKVQAPTATFQIDNSELKSGLTRYSAYSSDRAEVLPEMELSVEARIEGARDYERAPDTTARAKLAGILAGYEYRKVAKTQSPLEKLKDLALGGLIRLLRHLFESAAAHPRVSEVLLWTLIGSITLGFAVWLYFLLRRTPREEYSFPRGGDQLSPSYKRWQQWLAEAKAAADRAEWREAVHLAYWGGISYLESSGAWKPDRARTPREYLRMLPSGSERSESLTALTRRFETTWYAYQPASPADFEFSLSQLDKLGCR